tara:strand:+ start:16 stop:1425 length:1410 start_codon:yes stop_codon:yes gene_type:complete
MSYDLNSYFQLGLDSEATPQNSLVMNTIRTPVDVQSGRTGLSKVTFKVPKVGLLTGDSMITLQFQQNDATSSNVTPNFVSGALGCVERCRITIDNKVLTDLERPSMLEIPQLYSRNTQNEVAQFQHKFLANQFESTTDSATGQEKFNISKTRYFSDSAENTDTQNVVRNRVGATADSHVYGIHLKNLGAQFLDTDSLPVFLLGAREMIIELFFYKDCREYLVPTQGSLSAGDYAINYPNVELVTTHIQLPDEVQANEIASLQTKPLSYPLLDNYLVKGTLTTPVINTQTERIYRVNAQNRELHKLLIVHQEIGSNIQDNNRIVGNQKALSLGDVEIQIKSNGLNLYERPINNQSLIYQQTTYAHDGRALKLPYNACSVNDRVNDIPQSDQSIYLDYRGTQHYLAVDFKNGNGGVFGGGSMQKVAMEVDYKITPRVATNPVQVSKQVDTDFYLTVSKMLTIGARSVDISF